MKEVLFRGKKLNGEWTYGYYVQADYSWHDYGKHKEWIVCSAHSNGGRFALQEQHAVIFKTVGQYIGLKDENGTKIFEGDIVRDAETSDVGKIFFDTYAAMFVIGFETTIADFNASYSLEVIGNIYDNPELIGGETNG